MKEKEMVSNWEILVHEEKKKDPEEEKWIEKCKNRALRDKKNYQVVYSVAGSFQIFPIGSKFNLKDQAPHSESLRFRLVHETEYDFGETAKEEAPEDDDAVSEALQVKEVTPKEKPKKKGRHKKDEIDEDE